MAGDIKLKIGADTSDLEKAFGNLIKKIQSDADKLKLSPTASKAAPGAQVSTDRESARNKTFLDAQAKQYAAIVKSLKEEYGLLQQIGREREKQNRQEHIANIQKTTFAQTQRSQGWGIRGGVAGGMPPAMPPTAGGGGPSFPKGGITNLAGLAGALGIPGMALGVAASAIAAIKATETIRRFVSEAPLRAREVEASAFQTKGQGGQRLNSFLSGGASEELMFDPQRMQGNQAAQAAINARYSLSSAIKYNPMTQTIRGVYGDQTLGALQHGQFLQAARSFGGRIGIPGMQKGFEANKQQEEADLQATQTEALKNGPEGAARTATANKFLKDWQRNLGFQRQMGQSEGAFRSFLGGVNSAGFSDEQGMGMSSAIQGAGGSTRSATGNAAFALQMQRQFGLTNAGQALGSISGQLGSSEMSKEALIRIQAEGTRIGVNQSQFQEENRKFVEMAASAINQSTATSGAGVDQIVSTLGKFMGSTTISGQQAGLSAYQAYQAQSNVQTGPSAALRAAGMMRDPGLSKLSAEDQASLFTMNQADVNVDDRGIQAMAKKAGLTPQQLVDKYHGVQDSSTFNRKSTDAAFSNLTNQYKNQAGPVASGAAYGAGIEATNLAEGEALNALPLEDATKGLSRKAQMAFVHARGVGNTAEMDRLTKEVRGQAEAGQTGRPGDDMERQQAEASRLANGLFQSFKDSIMPASTAVRDFASSIDSLLKAMSGSPEQRAAALKNFNNQYPGVAPSNQPSAGPPANGAGQH